MKNENSYKMQITNQEWEIIQHIRRIQDGSLTIKVEAGTPCEVKERGVRQI